MHSGGYPRATRGTLVVWGMLGAFPFGGMTWQALHYVVGLRRLGFDVWYVEDADSELLDPETLWPGLNAEANVCFLSRWMERIGLADRWVFRLPLSDVCAGARDLAGLARLYREADAVINLCGYHALLPRHAEIDTLIYLQTDPMADQVHVARGEPQVTSRLDAHHHHFTYAENIGADDCLVPSGRYRWGPTRPPVCVDWWAGAGEPPGGAALTTVTNWDHWDNTVVWQGETYHWRKDREFRRFLSLPAHARVPIELAVERIDDQERDELVARGWRLTPAARLRDPLAYRDYIRASRGEFTVTKDQYTRPNTGWFSDRSACYLAAGRPGITQETGFSKFIPTGRGLFAFRTREDILAAIDAIESDYAGHARAAREIAAEYFVAEKVLGSMMARVGL